MAIYKGVKMPKLMIFVLGIMCGALLAVIIMAFVESEKHEKELEQEWLKTKLTREITAEVMKQLKENNLI